MRKNYFLTILAMLFCCLGMNAAAELTFSNVSLAPGSKLEALAQDQQITFNTNMDDQIGYMLGEIYDDTKGEMVLSFTTVYDPMFNNTGGSHEATEGAPQTKKEPHFTFVCPSYTKMYEGHTYSLNLRAYVDKAAATGAGDVLAAGSIKYEGATPAYVGSSIKLVSVTPDPETHVITSADNRSVTLHFDGMVRMDKAGTFVNTGNGSSADYESIVPGEDAKTVNDVVYSTSWTLTPKLSTISDGSDVIFTANAFDEEGLHVSEGTDYSTGADESSYYTFTVANDLGRETFDITPIEGIKNLSSVVVSTSAGISLANITDPAVLYEVAEDGTKTAVAQVTYTADLEVKKVSGDDVATSVRLMFDKAITKAGNYVLSFPRRYFNIGTGMTAGATAARDVEYTIKKDATPYTLAFDPSDEDKVTSLSEVKISFADLNEDGDPKYMVGSNDMEKTIGYVYNDHQELVTTTTFGYPESWDEYNAIVAKLVEPISTPGKYTLVVPDGQFAYGVDNGGAMARKQRTATRGGAAAGDDDEEGDEEESIDYNALIVKEFTVSAGSIENVKMTASIEDGATVGQMDGIELTFDGAESVATTSGMVWWKGKDVKGNYLTVSSVKGNVLTLAPSSDMTTATPITKKGTYVVSVPAGYIQVNGADWDAIEFTFTVDPTATGINGVETDGAAAAKQVYTLTGIKVNGKAQKGIFIVNGKKVVLK